MNYPVTDRYIADVLGRAADALDLRPGLQASVRELALFFELSDNAARLSMVDFESLAEYTAELVRRGESRRRHDSLSADRAREHGGPRGGSPKLGN